MFIKTLTTDEEPAQGSSCRQRIKEVVTMPCLIMRFVKRMRQRFGSYVSTAMLAYGVNQGITIQLGAMAAQVYYSQTLGIDGASMGRYLTIARMPWSMKPALGLISDLVPILGLHRNPYLVIAGCLGLIASIGPALLAPSALGLIPLALLGSVSTAWPDVVVDATSAELAKDYPENASDLQSLCWGSNSVGTFIGAALSGVLVSNLKPRGVWCLCMVGSLAVMIPGLTRRLPEKRVPFGVRKSKRRWLQKHAGLAALAIALCCSCVSVSLMQLYLPTPRARIAVTLVCAVVIAISLCVFLGRIATVLSKVALFLFLRECVMAQVNDAMFQWELMAPDGPQFSPVILGWVSCVGSAAFFFAVVVYNRYLTGCNYRKIFAVTQALMMLVGCNDIVFVMRWNKKMGIPDEVMLFGDAATHECFRSFFMMPTFVLASKVCPKEVEATLFALLMSLMQFGYNIGCLSGSSLLEFFGVVDGNWDDFYMVVAFKTALRIFPILMVPLLIPNLTPNDAVFGEWSTRASSDVEIQANPKAMEPPASPRNPATPRASQEKSFEPAKLGMEERPAAEVSPRSPRGAKDMSPVGAPDPERPAMILGTVAEHQGEADTLGKAVVAGPILSI